MKKNKLIKELLDISSTINYYLYEEEERHYKEEGKPEGHIFLNIKRSEQIINKLIEYERTPTTKIDN